MKKDLREILKQLNTNDILLLEKLYLLRCLDIRQVYRTFYKEDFSKEKEFYETKIPELVELGVVEIVEFNLEDEALFLTTPGVDVVRHTKEIEADFFSIDDKAVKRGYYRAGELKMNSRLVNHQVHLNQFVLDFTEEAENYGYHWQYFDEKYVSQYTTIRPDGLIRIFNTDFFIEMDMATESSKQLSDKWSHYRDFLRSREYNEKERNIVVLFITENTKNIESRKDLVRFTAVNSLVDVFHEGFDMHVGSRQEIMDLIFDDLIPDMRQTNDTKDIILRTLKQYHDFEVSYGDMLKDYLLGENYEFYAFKMQNKKLVSEFGRIQEFLVDDYTTQAFSVLHKLAYHQRNSNAFRLSLHRDISYIVVGKSEDSLYKDMKLADLLGIDGVYFTTSQRLQDKPLHVALFQFTDEGEIFHYKNSGLFERVYEAEHRN